MRSLARVALALGLAVAPGCQAFLGALRAAPSTSNARCNSVATASHSSSLFSSARSRAQTLSRSSGAAVLPLCMSGDDEAAAGPMPEAEAAEKPTTKSPSELMEDAAEADFVARASTAPVMGPAMGPAKQPEEDKRKQRESFELKKPKENKWASGAFKRGLALQV